MAFLESLHAERPGTINPIHRVCANARPHHGQQGRAWWVARPRFVRHCTPVPGSWLNQVEPWCSLLQRQRWQSADCASQAALRVKLMLCMAAGNAVAPPFNWTTKSVAQVMADVLPAAA